MHIGWSIEGAIGSDFKIDASYLSPSVNMAGKLEGCTKAYGIPMLISGSVVIFFFLFSKFLQLARVASPGLFKFMRQVDSVIVRGSNSAMELFTVDMDVEKLHPSIYYCLSFNHYLLGKDPSCYSDKLEERKYILK